jgi:hypothetical protein
MLSSVLHVELWCMWSSVAELILLKESCLRDPVHDARGLCLTAGPRHADKKQ